MRQHRSTFVAAALVLLLVAAGSGCGAGPEPAAAPPVPGGEPTPASDQSRAAAPIIEAVAAPDAPTRILDPRADQLLRAMATRLATTKTFAFEAEERFDEIPSGQPRTRLTNVRRKAVQRPNQLVGGALLGAGIGAVIKLARPLTLTILQSATAT